MFILKTNHILRPLSRTAKYLSTQISPKPNDEYTEEPVYPEIIDTSLKARKQREKQAWYDEVKNLNTVEEKLIKINMPRYYGYKTVVLSNNFFPYNCLPLTQHYTRTLFEQVEKLPEFYGKNEATVNTFVEGLKTSIQDSVEYAVMYYRQRYGDDSKLTPQQKDKLLGSLIVEQINRTLLNNLSGDCPHLKEVEIDLETRHEAFWFVGGVDPPKRIKKWRESIPWQKEFANDPVDRAVQYLGKPYLALRHKLPLEAIRSSDEGNVGDQQSKVPLYKYDARVIGYGTVHRHGTNVPGFWPGSPYEFGLLSYQPRDSIIVRDPAFGKEDHQEALHALGIQSSFAWLLAQACYQGFSTYNDLTYPLTTQTVVTNGKQWSFYGYQMDTTLVHSNQVYDNPKINYCWGTKEMNLFDNVDEHGKCSGLNEDILKYLIHFYVNAPAERRVVLKPYLGMTEKFVADIADDKRREFLETRFKHLVSNRPRHRSLPEIYMWEKIYKIDNKTRPMEPKRRFFELGINPFKRRLDEHTPQYIPKVVRPEGPKSKKKWEKTYYP